MKILKIIPAAGVIIVLLGRLTASAQTVDTTTGQEIGKVAPDPNTAKLTAIVMGTSEGSKIRGVLMFVTIGDAINVTGRVEGLEPLQRYQLTLDMDKPAEAATSGVTRKSESGAPAAGTPQAPNPNAGTPDAVPPNAGQPNAGIPDGQDRPGVIGEPGGSATTVTGNRTAHESESKSPIGNVGIVTADANGETSLTVPTLKNMDLSNGPKGLLGKKIIFRKISDDGTTPTAAAVAAALIVEVPKSVPVVPIGR